MPELRIYNPSSEDYVPLCMDFRREAAEFLDRYQGIEDLLRLDFQPHKSSWQTNPVDVQSNIGLPLINWPDPPPLRVNQIYWPTGASRFAYGLFLATGEQVRKIKALACDDKEIQTVRIIASTDSVAKVDSLFGETPRQATFYMHMLTPKRICGCQYVSGQTDPIDPDGILPPGEDATDYDLFLIPFVDSRYWWQHKTVDSPCASAGSWTDLISSIATGLGISIDSHTVPAAYTTCGPHASAWARENHNAALLLDAAVSSVGGRFVAKYDQTYDIEFYADAFEALEINMEKAKDQLAGTTCVDYRTATLPESVDTLYAKSSCGMKCGYCDGGGCIEDYIKKSTDLDSLEGDVSNTCTKADTAKTFHVRGFADMACNCGSATANNNSLLQAIHDQVVADWFNYNQYEYDFTFTGPLNWTPCGYDDHILHTFGGEYDDHVKARAQTTTSGQPQQIDIAVLLEQEHRRDYKTRIQSWPQTVGVDCLLLGTCVGERHGNTGMATAVDCIYPGSSGSATLNSTATSSSCTITVDNTDCLIFALPGDTFPVIYDDDCASDCTWRPAGQFGTTRRVRVYNTQGSSSGNPVDCEGAIECCATTTAHVLEDSVDSSDGNDCCASVESICEIVVCNTTNRKIASDKDYEDMIATLIPGKTCLWYLHDQRRPQRARAQLVGELCGNSSPEDPKVTAFTHLDVCEWQAPEEPLNVKNPMSFYACAGDLVDLAWNDKDCVWEIAAVPDHALPKPMLDISCHPDVDICTIQRKRPVNDSYGHSCKCDDSTAIDDTQMTGSRFDILVDVQTGVSAGGIPMLTGVDCGNCEIVFTTGSIGVTPMVVKKQQVCLYCPKEIPGGDATINSVGVSNDGVDKPISGTYIDVPTSVKAQWTTLDSSSGDDCPTAPGGILTLLMETQRICVFCAGAASSGAAEPEPGTPITFPIELKEVEGITEVAFGCNPCPTLTPKTTSFYAFCVGTETTGSEMTCECEPCDTSSS